MKVKQPIRLAHKLILLVILTAGLTVVLPSGLIIHRVSQAITDQVTRLTTSEARLGAAEIERTLRTDARLLQTLAIQLTDIADQPDLRETVLRRWFRENPEAVEVAFIPDAATAGPWRSRSAAGTVEERLDLEALDAGLAAYHGVAVGVTHRGNADDFLVITVRLESTTPALLVSTWRLDALSESLRRMGLDRAGDVFVVDHRGFLLAHPGSLGQGQDAPGPLRVGDQLAYMEVVKTVFEHPLPGPAPELVSYTSAAGVDVVAGGVLIPELSWAVIAEKSESEALGAVEELREDVLLVGATVGLVAILLGLAIVGTITRPLEELAEAANRVGAGDLTHPVGVATKDEIGVLALSFNEMQIRLREMYDKLERMVAERTYELEQTTDFLNSVLDSSTEYSIIAEDLRGTILSYNEGSRRIYGYDAEEIIGAPVTILLPHDEGERKRAREIFGHVRREGTYSGETVRVRKGGKRFPVRFVMTMRYDDAGKPVGYTTISRDITTQKEMEAKLREYTENLEALVAIKTQELQDTNAKLERANRLKAEFLASMSHELRTPLNAIIGFAGVLRDEMAGPLNADQKQFVNDVYKSGEQLLNLINDILDLSKVDSGRMELTPDDVVLSAIFDEVQTIIQGMAVRKRLALSFHQDPPDIVMTADRVKLLQILYNLLSNAAKFTPEGGSIHVEAQRREHDVCFRVIDTGMGIPREAFGMIFEEFRQVDSRLAREYGGTGLGLALTRKLVTLHGGTITVESEVGKGSTFIFTIPNVLPTTGDEVSLFTSA